MKISTKKSSLIPGIAASAFLLYLTISLRDRFFVSEKYGILLFVSAILLSLLTGALASVQIHFKKEKWEHIIHGVVFLLLPIVSITMVESMNGVNIWWLSPKSFIANYVLYLILNLLLYAITNSLRIPIIASNIFLFVFGFTNCLIKEFRGTPFVPTDILSAKTGFSVAHTYTYHATFNIILSFILVCFIVVCGFKLKKLPFSKKIGRTVRLSSLACVALLVIVTYTTDGLANLGYKPDFWNQTRGYEKSGAFLNFYLNSKYLIVHEPNEYASDNIATLMTNTQAQITGETPEQVTEENAKAATTNTGKTPNIICIMNETLSDLSKVGDFQTNIDYMPFLRSLTKNTIKGNLYMSVKGAGTCNSEFEFLTGNSIAFMPVGSSVYELYIKNPTASLVTTLGDQGYSRSAFHSYFPEGWNRMNVYSKLGFQDFTSIYSLINRSILDEYVAEDYNINYLEEQLAANYPNENMIMRRYVSDSYDYKKLISMYENRNPNQPFFLFNVTMQNHGGYVGTYTNFPQEVYVTSSEKTYPKTNQYLSLIKKSDEAFKELIDYFSQQDEPTIICMFGDHQPSIEDGFYKELYDGKDLNSLSLEEEQRQYITPFYIWANYDIGEQQIDKLSANYLSSLLLKTAGLPMTNYNQFLLDMSTEIPVINANGYIDKDGNNYDLNDSTSPYKNLIDAYEKIQYNNIFDSTNEQKNLFYLTDTPCNENNTLVVDGVPMETDDGTSSNES